MNKSEVSETYRSGYTMVVGGELKVCRDNIIFEPTPGDEGWQGFGEPDANGCRMKVSLKNMGGYLVGLWQEVDPMDQVVFGGEVDFSPQEQAGVFAGEWTMGEDGDFSRGFWALIKLQD